MKALVLKAPGKLEIKELKTPVPHEGEALIRIKAVGICSSDIHAYRGFHPFISYPRILGHEIAGQVVEVSKNDQNLTVGDLVVVNPVLSCGRCYPCRIGRPNCCIDVKTPGIHFDGGMCEYTSLSTRLLCKIPQNADPSTFALTEPLSIAMQAINRGKVSKEDSVAIIGSGPIGLSCLMVAKTLNTRVIIIDLLEYRLKVAKSLGADRVVNAHTEDPLMAVMDFTHREGTNVVIEAVGLPKTLREAVEMVSAAGRVVILGLSSKLAELPISETIKKELDIVASRLNNNRFSEAIKLIERGEVDMGSLVTHEFNLEEAEKAFKLLEKHYKEVMKIILRI
jgi:L-gulonate 5-dehydrogenase